MSEILAALKDLAPQALLFIVLAVGIGWYLKHFSEQVLSSFKTITSESRESYRLLLEQTGEHFKVIIEESRRNKEEIYKDLGHYKVQLAEYRNDNSQLTERLKGIEFKLASLEKLIDEIRSTMQKNYAEFQKGLGEFDAHSKALFAERDNILSDLDLAWKAIHRQHRITNPGVTEVQVDEFKDQLKDASA